jgi:putative ABC transport system permease protein
VLKAFLGALAGISMLVGGVGIMNIMLASVTERTREIGIRKAMGARERDIRLQFLAEAVVVSFVGSGAGVAVGMLLSVLVVAGLRAFTPATDIGFVISPWTVALAAGIAVAIGLAFGTYPARRAGRLSPIDAIRHE